MGDRSSELVRGYGEKIEFGKSNAQVPWQATLQLANPQVKKFHGRDVEGTVPAKLFSPRASCFIFLKLPSATGIVPVKLFLDTMKYSREDKFPTVSGIVPVKLFPRRSSF